MNQRFIEKYTMVQWWRPLKNNAGITKIFTNMESITQRIFLFSAVFCISAANTFAQDIITLRNGNDIQALVQEIGIDDVKYKRWDNQTGPNYTLKKSEIFMIKYANGDKEVFAADKAVPSIQSQSERELLYVTKSSFSGIKVKNSSGVTLLGHEITSTLANTPEALRLYNTGVAFKGVGTGFTIAGTTLVLIGFYSAIASGFQSYPWGWYVAGLSCIIPQMILTNAGNSKIDSAVGVYNASVQRQKRTDLSLAFGMTQSGGIGFTLNF